MIRQVDELDVELMLDELVLLEDDCVELETADCVEVDNTAVELLLSVDVLLLDSEGVDDVTPPLVDVLDVRPSDDEEVTPPLVVLDVIPKVLDDELIPSELVEMLVTPSDDVLNASVEDVLSAAAAVEQEVIPRDELVVTPSVDSVLSDWVLLLTPSVD